LTRLLGTVVKPQRMAPGQVRTAPVEAAADARATRSSGDRPPAWEYMTYLVVNGRDAFPDSGEERARSPHPAPLQDVLARAGAERWELAAIDVGARFTVGSHGHEGSIYIFKRPKRTGEST
jgi:hypothetical protein